MQYKMQWLFYRQNGNNRGRSHPLIEADNRPQTAAYSTATAQAAAQ